jgi:uncharacterized protein (TIGR03083 family)
MLATEIPRTTAALANSVNAAELAAFLAVLDTVPSGGWGLPTDCAGWTVHDLVAHVLGQHQGAASIRMFLRRHRVGHRRYPGRSRLDAMVQQQIDDLSGVPGPELAALMRAVGPKAVHAMARTPAFVKRLNITRFFPDDPLPEARLGYIFEVIAARDTWMHRVDLCRAIGRPVEVGTHDREIIAQVIRELGASWAGPPARLELTGAAGGRWRLGAGDPVAAVRADPVDYLRCLSGRNSEPDLDIDGDPEVGPALVAARVVF